MMQNVGCFCICHNCKKMHLFVQVLFLLTVTHAWNFGADHYWPLNEITYGRVYDLAYPSQKRWIGNIKGN